MVRSRVFGLLAIALCLVVCVSANAKVSEDEAMKAVKETQTITKQVLDKAETMQSESATLLNDVEKYKRDAEGAANAAEETAKKYPGAQSIAEKARSASNEVRKFYIVAFEKAKVAVSSMTDILSKAKRMNNKALNSFWVPAGPGDDFMEMQKKAEALKAKAELLGKKMENDVSKQISDAGRAQNGIPAQVEKALLAKYHADSFGAVAKINNLLKEVGANIPIMEKSRDEIDATVKEIYKLYEKAPGNLKTYIHTLYSTTEADLKSVKTEIDEAKEAQKEIMKHQKEAAAALAKVRSAAKTDDAKRDAGTAATAASGAEKIAEDIKKDVEELKTCASNALARRKSAEKSIEKGVVVVVTRENVTPSPSPTDKPNPSTEGSTGAPDTSKNEESDKPERDSAKSPMKGITMSIKGVINISVMTVAVPLFLALITRTALHWQYLIGEK